MPTPRRKSTQLNQIKRAYQNDSPVSLRAIHAEVERMLSEKPLTPLTREQKRLVKQDALFGMSKSLTSKVKLFRQVRQGKAGLFNADDVNETYNPLELLNDPIKLHQAHFKRANSTWPVAGWVLRGLEEYRNYGIDLLALVKEQIPLNRSKINVLDLGAGAALALHQLKEHPDINGVEIETHATGVDELPHFPVDQYHVAINEHLPASFKGKYHVITSSRSIEFSPLPGLIINNAALALAPGGTATLFFQPNLTHLHFKKIGVKKTRPPLGELTRAKKLAAELAPNKKEELDSPEHSQLVNYLAAIQKLKESKEYEVQLKHVASFYGSSAPMLVKITRKQQN